MQKINQSRIIEKLRIAPEKPGVYLMKDCANHIIYIGKAKNLKKRLSSYFNKGAHDQKVSTMLSKTVDFDFFIVASEKDALGLEANLVKKHKPHYNILLKDNKQFPYIKIVDAKFPYLEVTRKITKGGKYFGPYFHGISANQFLQTIADIFPIRCCKTMDKEPCINYQIGRCSAPCGERVTVEEYAKIIEDVKKFLSGESEFNARKTLENKMMMASELQQFELAIRYREGIKFLDNQKDKIITQVPRDLNADFFGSCTSADIVVISVVSVRAGKVVGIQNYSDENKGVQNQQDALDGFAHQYYLEHPRPSEVVLTAEKGIKRKLLDMANDNAKEYMNTSIEKINFKKQFNEGACEELQRVLNLQTYPKRIECFDISNLFGSETVASMVVFVDGRAEKKLYRRFKVKWTGEGTNENNASKAERPKVEVDDYRSHKEVLARRLNRKEWEYPDLIIIDGGKGQLSATKEIAGDIPIIAFSENSELFTLANPSGLTKGQTNNFGQINLPARSYALRLLQRIRDEAHRFAITYHRKLRDKKIAQKFLPKDTKN